MPGFQDRTGCKNKLNLDIKEVFDNAFDANGGDEWLKTWAKSHPTAFFKIYARMQPKKIIGDYRHTHEGFVQGLIAEADHKQKQIGKPFKMIDCQMGNDDQIAHDNGENDA